LGVPINDQGRFKTWSDDIAVVLDGSVRGSGLPAAADSAAELSEYLRAVVVQRRQEPREDLISRMIAARDHNDALSDDELVANCILLLLAGHETTTNLIGNGALALMRHPDQLERLRRDPTLAASAVEECLRYDAPVQLTSREPLEDLELFGVKFPKGIEIDVIIGSANRDERRFENADQLDIGRDAHHVSFGHGAHFCLGAPLARLEGEIALGRLAKRLPELALDTDDLVWRPGLVLRGLQSLPVSF
jgi:cytochrome P450